MLSLNFFFQVAKSRVTIDHESFPGVTNPGDGLFAITNLRANQVFFDLWKLDKHVLVKKCRQEVPERMLEYSIQLEGHRIVHPRTLKTKIPFAFKVCC